MDVNGLLAADSLQGSKELVLNLGINQSNNSSLGSEAESINTLDRN